MPEDEEEDEDIFSAEEGEDNPPNAGLARTLSKALNYTFFRAIADLIDNSIAADANNIWLHIEPKDGESGSSRPFVAVVDDGHGMSLERLKEAMVYGAPTSDSPNNLGNFGLGMKTASTSQSFILAVSTRENENQEYSRRAWDIPWMETNGWQLRVPNSEIFPGNIMSNIEDTSGTAVLLYDLSRMKSNINELVPQNQVQSLQPKITECVEYIGMVFHRFISGNTLSEEYAGRQINIFMNGQRISPWDPFMSDHENYEEFEIEETAARRLVHCHPNTGKGSVEEPIMLILRGNEMKIRLHLLPKLSPGTSSDMPPLDPLHAQGAGRMGRGWNGGQGVYVYRLDRMIEFGGWFRLLKNEPHYSLARISIDFGRDWDDSLELTATKDRIIIPDTPPTFRNDFKSIFGKLRGASNTRVRGPWPNWPPEDAEGEDDDSGEDEDTPIPPSTPVPTPDPTPTPNPPPRPRKRLDNNTLERLLEACQTEEERNMIGLIWMRATRQG